MTNINAFIASFTLVVLIILSALSYSQNHKDKNYKIGKEEKIQSSPIFYYVIKYFQFSSIIINLFAYNFKSPYLMCLFEGTFTLYIGLSLMICGYFVFASGKSTLAKEYSPCFDSYIPKTVIREGVYKYIRHPIYTGNLISFFGLFISNGSLWNLLNLFVLIYFYIDTTHQEEKALSNKFKDYSEYCKSTGKFFPKLKSLRQISIF